MTVSRCVRGMMVSLTTFLKVFALVLLSSGVAVVEKQNAFAVSAATDDANTETVRLELGDILSGEEFVPTLPDVSRYTREWMESAKRGHLASAQKVPPALMVENIYKVPPLREFTEGRRAVEWLKRQDRVPHAIVLESGVFTLSELVSQVGDEQIALMLDAQTALIRLPLLIGQHATLLLEPEDRMLLSQEKGAFLINEGHLFSLEAALVGWNESKASPAVFQADRHFRPFFAGFGVSQTYFYGSTLTHLGYFNTKSYGFTISSNPLKYSDDREVREDDPKVWLINNYWEQLYYGFYSFEAYDSIIVGNRYFDSIVYGIDPHDYSRGLVIAENKVTHTQRKHGIIISREVDDSWIFRNISTDNAGSGFVLDRQCSGNIVAFNIALRNQGDGISFYESPDNVLYGNVFSNNAKHGLRVRNSYSIRSVRNILANNNQQGIYIATAHFSANERNLEYDKYTARADLKSIEDQIAANGSGAIGADNVYPLDVSGPRLSGTNAGTTSMFVGALAPYADQLLTELLRNKHRVILRLESE